MNELSRRNCRVLEEVWWIDLPCPLSFDKLRMTSLPRRRIDKKPWCKMQFFEFVEFSIIRQPLDSPEAQTYPETSVNTFETTPDRYGKLIKQKS
jgi:hypothetical protein